MQADVAFELGLKKLNTDAFGGSIVMDTMKKLARSVDPNTWDDIIQEGIEVTKLRLLQGARE